MLLICIKSLYSTRFDWTYKSNGIRNCDSQNFKKLPNMNVPISFISYTGKPLLSPLSGILCSQVRYKRKLTLAGYVIPSKPSEGKRLGVKILSGQWANQGDIIIRQHGYKYKPANHVIFKLRTIKGRHWERSHIVCRKIWNC
ncbi:hypothetical protein ROZALSC1DRAFT_23817 [Rozella allomycis CSF55]|uniref:Ribosomal protein L27 domain-containing protein n=1 Tax=Rozella allomycis (strain CSF55) TaxID=988480 RepID=A0A4P9YGR2_ROZAC|nr:hypothetical protein ROZALSC1DRAFT_23817 [Rozella allomycis CSF55]